MNRDCLCRIRSLYRAIGAFEHDFQRQFGLNINEAMLLCIVSDRARISASEIAKELGLTHSNASKIIAGVENRRLIVRHACREDLRCMRFSITRAGSELLERIDCDSVQLPERLRQLTTDG